MYRAVARAVLLLVALLLATPAAAAITCTAAIGSTGTGPTITTGSVTVASNSAVYVLVHDHTESVTLSSISDTGTGEAYTTVSGPNSHSSALSRVWTAYRTAGSVGSITVTATLSASAGAATIAVAVCNTDLGGGTMAFQSAAADAEQGPGGFATAWLSNTRTFAQSGVLICGLASNNTAALSAVGTNQSNVTAGSARVHMVRRLESTGTVACNATMDSGGGQGWMSAALFYEQAGGGGGPGPTPVLFSTLGVGD
jgi:hypothetical protein